VRLISEEYSIQAFKYVQWQEDDFWLGCLGNILIIERKATFWLI
jgi:hypothetical protein